MRAEEYVELMKEFNLISMFPNSDKNRGIFVNCGQICSEHVRKLASMFGDDVESDYTVLIAATIATKLNFAAFLVSTCLDQEVDVVREKLQKLRKIEQENLDKFMEFVSSEIGGELKVLKKGFELRNAENN